VIIDQEIEQYLLWLPAMSLLYSTIQISLVAGRRSKVVPLKGIACSASGPPPSSACHHHHRIHKRRLSVKELSWCAPKASPNNNNFIGGATKTRDTNAIDHDADSSIIPDTIPAFGIVAAMSQNRVIGLQGQIPWPRSAQDRQLFKDLTRNNIMILGRTTYEEQPEQKHISHASHCIVVSSTLTEDQLLASNQGAPDTVLKVSTSFPEALGLAKKLLNNDNTHDKNDNQIIKCWVCGGERIYVEALKHKSAQQVHLTTMHLDVDISAAKQEDPQVSFAMFPAKHRWDRRFREISRTSGGPTGQDPSSPEFTYVIYERKKS